MKTHSILFAVAAMLLVSCSSNKEKEQEQLVIPISVQSIDSLTIDTNNGVHYWLTIGSPLPESLLVDRSEMKRIDGDTTIYYHKFATIVPAASIQFLGKYKATSRVTDNYSSPKKRIIRVQFWRDSVTTVDTVLLLK